MKRVLLLSTSGELRDESSEAIKQYFLVEIIINEQILYVCQEKLILRAYCLVICCLSLLQVHYGLFFFCLYLFDLLTV